jgi:hypothetical protein
MEGIEKSHMDKYKKIMNEWNYDGIMYVYITSSLGLRKFQALGCCWTECNFFQHFNTFVDLLMVQNLYESLDSYCFIW